jgi:hypothetical protein
MLSWNQSSIPFAPRGWQDPPALAPDSTLVVCGAHGGAGATTLAALLRPALDAGAAWLRVRGGAPWTQEAPGPLVIACRPTIWSAGMATAAVNAFASAGQPVDVLVIVDDGSPKSAVAAGNYQLLSAQVRAIVRMPFVPALLGCTDPLAVRLPWKARRALRAVRTLAVASAYSRLADQKAREE